MVHVADQLAVVLTFDDAADAAVRALREILIVRGLAPAPLSVVPPHITLVICTGVDSEQFRPVLADLAAESSAFGCTLSSVGAFASAEGVIFLAPTPSHTLLQLHEHVLNRMLRFAGDINPYFREGAWVPHCTLAIGVEPAQMSAAFAACLEAFQPISVKLVEVAAVEISGAAPSSAQSYALGSACRD